MPTDVAAPCRGPRRGEFLVTAEGIIAWIVTNANDAPVLLLPGGARAGWRPIRGGIALPRWTRGPDGRALLFSNGMARRANATMLL